jgi:hypothetical protein
MSDEVTLLKRSRESRSFTTNVGFALTFHSLTFASPWGRGDFITDDPSEVVR